MTIQVRIEDDGGLIGFDRDYQNDTVRIVVRNAVSDEDASLLVDFGELTRALRMIGIGEHEARA